MGLLVRWKDHIYGPKWHNPLPTTQDTSLPLFVFGKVSRIISEKQDNFKSGPVGKTNHIPGKGCG